MMLIDKIKQKVKKLVTKKTEEKIYEKEFRNRLEEQLVVLKSKTIKALRTLNGEKCSQGTLRLLTGQKAMYDGKQRLAVLELDFGKYRLPAKIVVVNAGIQSGTIDMSDDCRNIPYTDAFVSFSNACKMRGDRDQAGLWYLNEYASSEESLEDALEVLTEHLAPLFS